MEKEKIDIGKYCGQIVKLTLEDRVCVASLNRCFLDNFVTIGHPYDTDIMETWCGNSSFAASEILSIDNVTSDELNAWVRNYNKFHSDAMNDKGYDSCEENVSELIRNTELKIKEDRARINVTSVLTLNREDIVTAGFDGDNITNDQLLEIADSLNNYYLDTFYSVLHDTCKRHNLKKL